LTRTWCYFETAGVTPPFSDTRDLEYEVGNTRMKQLSPGAHDGLKAPRPVGAKIKRQAVCRDWLTVEEAPERKTGVTRPSSPVLAYARPWPRQTRVILAPGQSRDFVRSHNAGWIHRSSPLPPHISASRANAGGDPGLGLAVQQLTATEQGPGNPSFRQSL
jgi:hypothetical protein